MRVYANTVASVGNPATLLMLLPETQSGWCEQLSQEGYNVVHALYPNEDVDKTFKEAQSEITKLGTEWALLSYGLLPKDASALFALHITDLRACIHFCPTSETKDGYLVQDESGRYTPTIFHLAASQETLHASLLPSTDPGNLGYSLLRNEQHPIHVFTYPLTSASPAFPLKVKPPALLTKSSDKGPLDDVHTRAAANMSYTRTLKLIRKHLGPELDIEKTWDMHTYFEFAEKSSAKTMSTMVAAPYVNHVPTMTGGVGAQDVTRFYKHHFCAEHVTPPDAQLVTVSRTVGVDKIVDEMYFKCTHTTEIDYFLPGIPPTGKQLEIAIAGVVALRGDKLYFEHLYWDQASVLVQLGLLDPSNLPVAGVDVARKVVYPFDLPSNTLMAKWKESEGKDNE
ncbi:hypothetical protein PILCRDRAFT_827314 [Piloderma croceum F 1598]|uniref:SnoaL-like domain-containing protein n=1 Tax=Piloderma croceum (strain F 1598) TaxID=765440 RepID=A0A0C3F656_PILCF|nr:hypothetical protein PILCRDRAFT_827314 [Piloderma croceum F 1598]